MNDYKWSNQEKTSVHLYPNSFMTKGGHGWDKFLEYVKDGGEVDPFKTFDEWVADALSRLWDHSDSLIAVHPEVVDPKLSNKLTGALNRKVDGIPKPKDAKILSDNDIIDSWLDDMEVAAETDGEQWIEDPARTEQELIDFDPAVQVSWPDFPIL